MVKMSAAYQRAWKWKRNPIVLKKRRPQEGGKRVFRHVWMIKKVDNEMAVYITQEDRDKAAALLAQKNQSPIDPS